MEKIIEHTYGSHIYMKMKLDDEKIEEIDVYLREDEEHYKTTADHDEEPDRREEIIKAFYELY